MSQRILVIDDEIETLSFLGILLHAAGFEVEKASSPEEGLRLAHLNPPDLVLLDVMMPGMDGWAVSERLRQMGEMPIIFVTALRGMQDQAKGMFLGDDYIVKPFDPRELVQRVRAQIERTPSPSAEAESLPGEPQD